MRAVHSLNVNGGQASLEADTFFSRILMRKQAMAWSIQLALMGVAATAGAQTPAPGVQQLDTVQVTGSRIPRAQVEGPAPVTVITAEQIQASGFTSVPDVLRSMTQNGGETQSQQSSSGADFSPGAQQVDLRGLGPNHTLVLVNGPASPISRCRSRAAATSPMSPTSRSG